MAWNKEQIHHIADVVHLTAVGQWVAFGFEAFKHDRYVAAIPPGLFFLALECLALALLEFPKTASSRAIVIIFGVALGFIAIGATPALYAMSPASLTIATIQAGLLALVLGAVLVHPRSSRNEEGIGNDPVRDPSREIDAQESRKQEDSGSTEGVEQSDRDPYADVRLPRDLPIGKPFVIRITRSDAPSSTTGEEDK